MTLHIEDPRAAELALQLSAHTGKSADEATIKVLEERLARTAGEERFTSVDGGRVDQESESVASQGLAERLMAIGRHSAALPILEEFDPDTWLYDENGLPH